MIATGCRRLGSNLLCLIANSAGVGTKSTSTLRKFALRLVQHGHKPLLSPRELSVRTLNRFFFRTDLAAVPDAEPTAKSVYNAGLIPAVNAITVYRGSRCVLPACYSASQPSAQFC